MPNFASGGASVDIGVAVITGGFKRHLFGIGTQVDVNSYGGGKKLGWMQWRHTVKAVPEAGGFKAAAGGATVTIHAGISLKQPLGHTKLVAFPVGTPRTQEWWTRC